MCVRHTYPTGKIRGSKNILWSRSAWNDDNNRPLRTQPRAHKSDTRLLSLSILVLFGVSFREIEFQCHDSPLSSPFPTIPLISQSCNQSREAPPFDEAVTIATFQGDETTNASDRCLCHHNRPRSRLDASASRAIARVITRCAQINQSPPFLFVLSGGPGVGRRLLR